MTAKDAVRVATFPDDVLAVLKEAWAKTAKEEGDRDYFFRSVLEDIDKFRAKSVAGPAPLRAAEQPPPAQASPAPQGQPK